MLKYIQKFLVYICSERSAMETTNKTTEHGVHNSKIHDNAAKIVFGDSTLCAQFLKGYTDIPFFTNIKPEDIEDVSSHFIPFISGIPVILTL